MTEAFRCRQSTDVCGLAPAVLAFVDLLLRTLIEFVLVPTVGMTDAVRRRQRIDRLVAQAAILTVIGLFRRRKGRGRQYA